MSGVPVATKRIDGQLVLFSAVLAVMVILVFIPIALTVLNSFRTSWVGPYSDLGLQGWRAAVGEPGIRASLLNTATLLITRTLISFPIAILIAWLLARTDLPGRRWLEFLFWVLFFMPALAVTLGWILLLDAVSGLLRLNIYSFWGIVWVHLASSALSFKVILLTPLFRRMDGTLEEASRVCGATRWQTVRRILLPAMMPATTLVLIAAVLYGLQTFEIELILGTPIRFFVYSTKIYALLRQEPPLFGAASALSSLMLLLIVPAVVCQRWLLERRHYATVTGRFVQRQTALGAWRGPAFVLVSVVAVVLTLVPLSMLVVGSLMKLLGYFQIRNPWTLAHWRRVLTDAIFVRSAVNTITIGLGTALASVIACTLVAYLSVRTRYRARFALDVLSWLPIGLPGILVGVGLVAVFSGFTAFRPLYGTVTLLIIASVIVMLAIGTQLVKTGLLQIGPDLEEASRTVGASRFATVRHIVVPLLGPVLLLVAVMSFTRATQDVSTMALLATARSRPLSLLQIDYMTSGEYESATVIATLISAMSIGGAFLARLALKRLHNLD